MNDLNSNIDQASKFQAQPTQDMPVNDQSGHANFALNLATRKAEQAAAAQPEPVSPPLGYMPIPN